MKFNGRPFLYAVCLTLPGACASPGPTPLNYSVRQVPNGDRDRLFQVAESALLENGFQIAVRDRTAGVLSSVPIEGPPRTNASRLGMRLSTKGSTRRMAEVRFQNVADGYRVNCKVMIQEQTTEAQRFFAGQSRGAEASGETPIDRDAATTDEQNSVWKTIGRDQATERRILESILAGAPGSNS